MAINLSFYHSYKFLKIFDFRIGPFQQLEVIRVNETFITMKRIIFLSVAIIAVAHNWGRKMGFNIRPYFSFRLGIDF